MPRLPDLSRFELQCLRLLWTRGEASVRQLHEDLQDPPTYSTVRKIFERLEEKGAIKRVRREGKAWIYRAAVPRSTMMRKEILRFIDTAFDGSAAGLVAQLAEMNKLGIEDLREIEKVLKKTKKGSG